MSKRGGLLGLLAGIGAASIWGGMYVVSDVVLELIPPFTLLFVRLVIAIPVLAVALRLTGWPRLSRQQVLRLLAVGVVGYGVSVGAQFVGTKLSTAANGALVTSTTPAFVALFAALLLGEALTGKRLAALVLATVGVAVVINPAQADFSQDAFWGNVALLVAGVTWGLYSVLAKSATQEASSLTVALVGMVGGFIVMGILTPFELARNEIGPLTVWVALGVLYLGVISTAVAMYLWTKSFELLDAGLAGLTFFAQPVVGALLGVLLLGERLPLSFFVGGGLILVGVSLLSVPGRRRNVPQTDAIS